MPDPAGDMSRSARSGPVYVREEPVCRRLRASRGRYPVRAAESQHHITILITLNEAHGAESTTTDAVRPGVRRPTTRRDIDA